ncbi:hypothetical protein [Streptomyces sp. bgisy082]|uniref:hypothetical protein n=1 Tax=Streptomyces sp. bgisy082 TaxID=3413776 RepID=UPI003D740EC7
MPVPEVAVSDEEVDAAVRLAETLTGDIAELREEETFRVKAASEALNADLLLALASLKTQKEAVDAQIRQLLAYGREFHSSHPYSLEELFRIRLGHSDILPTCPTGQARSDVTRSCGRPRRQTHDLLRHGNDGGKHVL